MAMDHPFYDDPLNDLSFDPSAFFDENPPTELYLNYPDPGHELHDILDSDDPLSDPYIWAFCNETGNNNDVNEDFSVVPSRFHDESGNHGDVNGDVSMPFSAFSVTQSDLYDCTFCQTLRDITHTNGMNVKRLEIHGRLGIINHAVLGKYDFDSSFQTHELQMFDFHKESIQTVKKFLIQYFEACKHEGYNTVHDPLSTFYEALWVGLNEPDNSNEFLQLSPEITDDCPNNREETLYLPENRSNEGRFMKIPLAMQRERTRNLNLKDFEAYFHLPIDDAARKLNLCPTVMKKICRRNGVLRWPYRKIKSIQTKICKKMKILESDDHNEEKGQALEDIQKHEQELANIYEAFCR